MLLTLSLNMLKWWGPGVGSQLMTFTLRIIENPDSVKASIKYRDPTLPFATEPPRNSSGQIQKQVAQLLPVSSPQAVLAVQLLH